MDTIFDNRKAERFNAGDTNPIIGARAYNALMSVVVLYGLAVNALLCGYMYFHPEKLPKFSIAFVIGYVVLCFAGVFISSKSKSAFISFLGYNLVVLPMGLLVSMAVVAYASAYDNIVFEAIAITAGIVLVMTVASILFPGIFAKLAGMIFFVFLGFVIVEVIMLFLGFSPIIMSWIGAGIFAVYIGVDIYRAQQFPKTADNAVDCALDLYIDIINLFMRVLRILGNSKSGK